MFSAENCEGHLEVTRGQIAKHAWIYMTLGSCCKCLVLKIVKVIWRSPGVKLLNMLGFTWHLVHVVNIEAQKFWRSCAGHQGSFEVKFAKHAWIYMKLGTCSKHWWPKIVKVMWRSSGVILGQIAYMLKSSLIILFYKQ